MKPAVHLAFKYDATLRRLKVTALEAAGCDAAVFLYRRPHPAFGPVYIRVCRPEDMAVPAGTPDADGYHRGTVVDIPVPAGQAGAAIGAVRAAVTALVRAIGRPAAVPADGWKEWITGDD